MADKKLKVLRLLNDINQDEMAELLNITLSTYSKKETGKASFTLEEAKKIADYFKTTIDELFFSDKVNFTNTTEVV